MRRFFRPSIWVMGRLKYLQKFLLLAVFLGVPFAVLRNEFRTKTFEDIDFSTKELYGILYLEPTAQLLRVTLHYLTLTPVADQLDDPTLLEERSTLDQQIGEALAAVDAVDAQYGAILQVTPHWADLRAEIEALRQTYPQMQTRQRNDTIDALTQRLLRFITRVGNTSNLILDPDIDTYYYMDTVVTQLPQMATYLNEINSTVIGALSGRGLRLQDTTLLVTYEEIIINQLASNQQGFEFAFEYNPALREDKGLLLTGHVGRVQSFLLTTSREILGRAPGFRAELDRSEDYGTAAGFYRAARNTIDAVFAFRSTVADGLYDLIDARANGYYQRQFFVGSVLLLGVIPAIYFAIGFYLSVRGTIDDLNTATNRMVKGDNAVAFEPHTQDELAEVGLAFDKIGRKLMAARDSALESARAKSSFLATMSHELRTPLNAILGFTGILMSGMVKGGAQLAPTQQELLQRIDTNGRRLRDVINDILDLAKIEAGRITVTVTEARPRQFLDETVSAMRSLALNKGIALELHFAASAPEVVLTDMRKVSQMLTNLLGNAIKFTQKGGVYVEVRGGATPADWQIEVRDTGIGIPKDSIGRIFETFRQVDESDRREYEGTGLGLAIVRSLAEAMQGSVAVVSEVNHGSTFTITLPKRLDVKEV
jgi:signal transduction histidine kinase